MEKEKKPRKNKILRFSDILIIVQCFLSAASGWFAGKNMNEFRNVCIFILVVLFGYFLVLRYAENVVQESKELTYRSFLINELETNNDKKDVIRLMLKNNDEITEYFKLSKKQEKISYGVSIACAVIGVAMLGVAVMTVIFEKGAKETIITIIGGAVTEVVSGVVLWIHEKSASQLNRYYESLHENEKFLSAINLADKLKDKKKEKMYIEIIKAQIDKDEQDKEK